METPVLIALIAGAVTLLSALTSAGVSLYLRRKPSPDSVRTQSLDYLRHKVGELERHRLPVIEEKHVLQERPDNLDHLDYFYDAQEISFLVSYRLFESVQHYLTETDSDRLEAAFKKVNAFITANKLETDGIVTAGDIPDTLDRFDTMLEMGRVIGDLEKSISSELRRTTRQIESTLTSAA